MRRTLIIIGLVALLAGSCFGSWQWGNHTGYNTAYIIGFDAGHQEGYNVGYEKGAKDGHASGYREGYVAGDQAGYDNALRGCIKGVKRGKEELTKQWEEEYKDGVTRAYKKGYSDCMDSIRDIAKKSRITSKRIHYRVIDDGQIVVVTTDVFEEVLDRGGWEPY
ncbi:hypothetical protein GW916_15995 [bacterium]|nr:hypothetical protein [bacterium]